MSEIIRGTTPTHVFNTDVDLSDCEEIYVTYAQKGTVIINKYIDDLELTSETVAVTLTQTDTLKLDTVYNVEIQIRALFDDGTAIASNIIAVDVKRILKDGVIY